MSIPDPLFQQKKEIKLANIPQPSDVFIHSIAVSPSGERFFLSDEFNHRILVTDSDGDVLFVIGEKGNQNGQFWYPKGIAIAKNGGAYELVICDSWNHRLQRFNFEGVFLGALGKIGHGDQEFNDPTSIISDEEGVVWVLDRCNHRIKKVSLDGKTLSIIGRSALDEVRETKNALVSSAFGRRTRNVLYGFSYPQGFAKLKDGSLLIADTGSQRLCHINQDGTGINVIKLNSSRTASRYYPDSVVALAGRFILVSGLNMPCRVINIDKPWIEEELEIDVIGSRMSAPAMFTLECDGEMTSLLIAKRDLRECIINTDIIDKSSMPAPFPDKDDLAKVPNAWTETGASHWATYFETNPSDIKAAELASEFLDVSKYSAMVQSSQLDKIEGSICEEMVGVYEANEFINGLKAQQKPFDNELNEFAGQILTIIEKTEKRFDLMLALMGDVARICELLYSAYGKEHCSQRLAEFTDLLKSAYNNRKDNFLELEGWLQKRLDKDKLGEDSYRTMPHAFMAALFLIDHIDYLNQAVHSIDATFQHNKPSHMEKAIRKALITFHASPRDIIYRIPYLLGGICEDLGYLDSARLCYKNEIEKQVAGFTEYDEQYFEALFKLEEKTGKDPKVLVSILLDQANKYLNPSGVYYVASRLMALGEYDSAIALSEKHIHEPNEDLRLLSSYCAIKKESDHVNITLCAGQSISDLERAGDSFSEKISGFGYIKSVYLKHPDTKMVLQPLFMIPITSNSFIFSDWPTTVDLPSFTNLYIYEERDGVGQCDIFIENVEGVFCGLYKNPSGLLYGVRVIGSGQRESRQFVTIDTDTKKIADVSERFKCKMPPLPSRAFFHAGGDMIAHDYGSANRPPQTFRINSSMDHSEVLYSNAYYQEIAVCNDKMVASEYLKDDSKSREHARIVIYDLVSGAESFLGNRYLWNPTGVYMDENGIVFVSNGSGLQLFDQDGELQAQIERVVTTEGVEHTFSISTLQGLQTRTSRRISGGDNCLGGDMFVIDPTQGAIHIFEK